MYTLFHKCIYIYIYTHITLDTGAKKSFQVEHKLSSKEKKTHTDTFSYKFGGIGTQNAQLSSSQAIPLEIFCNCFTLGAIMNAQGTFSCTAVYE